MKNLKMVDLHGQYLKIKDEIDQAILETVESTWFVGGPKVASFKKALEDYLGVKHVIPCANGTDALQVAMMALDLKPGDEVIVPAFTYVATAEVIALLGLTPIMVDVQADHFMLCPNDIEQYITDKTKAIVPVHLFGQVAPMDGIMQLAQKHKLYVIEDNAQAIGADYTFPNGNKQKAGSIGHIGTTSFFPAKNLGCFGDGGAIFTNDDQLAERIASIANHGQSKTRYYHDLVGVNSRLDAIQAAVLEVKLKYLDEYARLRNEVAQSYDDAFKDIEALTTPHRVAFSNHVFHQYTMKVANGKRDALRAHLQERSIPHNVYYPVPLYEQKAYKDLKGAVDFLPVTDQLCKDVISLPIHTEMNPEILNHICTNVTDFFKK
ncbi:MAG: DegT/DnrJ/EryC1/StrS family aminotransferase [Bacteroidota bacterium]